MTVYYTQSSTNGKAEARAALLESLIKRGYRVAAFVPEHYPRRYRLRGVAVELCGGR